MTQVPPSVGVQEGAPDLDQQRGGYQTANIGESLQGDGCQTTGMQQSYQGGAEHHTKGKGESLQGDEYQTSGLGESSYGPPTEPPPAYDNAPNAGEPQSARRPPHIYPGLAIFIAVDMSQFTTTNRPGSSNFGSGNFSARSFSSSGRFFSGGDFRGDC